MATERFEMRIDSELLERLDEWGSEQEDTPSRAEAVRRLIELGLSHGSKGRAPHFTDGEKLITLMVSDLLKGLNIQTDTNLPLVEKAILGGHYWALGWEMPGIYHGHNDKESRVSFVVDVLDMWSFIEEGYEVLTDEAKERLAKEADPFGTHVKFRGFDGNNEAEYMSIARFLVHDLDRFTRFKDHDFNSHSSTLVGYGRMVRAFEPIRATLIGRRMSVEELATVLNARRAE